MFLTSSACRAKNRLTSDPQLPCLPRRPKIKAPMPRYDAVLFDLLTALLDSWTLWNDGRRRWDCGRRWRAEYLRITYTTGTYRPYQDLVAQAAEDVGLDRSLAASLDATLRPTATLARGRSDPGTLSAGGMKLGVVTNCSRRLGRIASGRIDANFAVSSLPRTPAATSRIRGLPAGVPTKWAWLPDRCLFVAGSSYDLIGTAKVGLATYWHDGSGWPCPAKRRRLWRMTHLGGFAWLPGHREQQTAIAKRGVRQIEQPAKRARLGAAADDHHAVARPGSPSCRSGSVIASPPGRLTCTMNSAPLACCSTASMVWPTILLSGAASISSSSRPSDMQHLLEIAHARRAADETRGFLIHDQFGDPFGADMGRQHDLVGAGLQQHRLGAGLFAAGDDLQVRVQAARAQRDEDVGGVVRQHRGQGPRAHHAGVAQHVRVGRVALQQR